MYLPEKPRWNLCVAVVHVGLMVGICFKVPPEHRIAAVETCILVSIGLLSQKMFEYFGSKELHHRDRRMQLRDYREQADAHAADESRFKRIARPFFWIMITAIVVFLIFDLMGRLNV